MRRSADKISGDLVKLLGRKVLFTKHRIKPGTVPDGMRLYEVGSHWLNHGKPGFLMNRVTKHFFGSVLSSYPIQLHPAGYRYFNADEFERTGEQQVSVSEYASQNPPTGKRVSEILPVCQDDYPLLFLAAPDKDWYSRYIGDFLGYHAHPSGAFHVEWGAGLNRSLDTDVFRADADRVMRWLQQKDGPLFCAEQMNLYCGKGYFSKIRWNNPLTYALTYGFQIKTDQYRYLFRLSPVFRLESFYVCCYQRNTVA